MRPSLQGCRRVRSAAYTEHPRHVQPGRPGLGTARRFDAIGARILVVESIRGNAMADAEQSIRKDPKSSPKPESRLGFIRHGETGLVGLGLVSGAIAGLVSAAILAATRLLHLRLFGVPFEAHLSSLSVLQSPLQAAIPIAGGLLIGFSATLVRSRRPHRPIDPIEANALHGGKMSLGDSLLIAGETTISNGFGASVGVEAAYTQIGSGLASRLGAKFRPRRADMRILVACGSAGAISAAFGAPLAGTFYAFELVLGSYTPFALGPVGAAAIGGAAVSRWLGMTGELSGHLVESTLAGSDIVSILGLGVLCSLFGIAMMRGVAAAETLFRGTRLPRSLHPALGGVVVGALALVTPQVLGSGHGALHDVLLRADTPEVEAVALLLVVKATASVISLGSGFRGGLFYASLLLGALLGCLYAAELDRLAPDFAPDPRACMVTGMAALAVAVVGGPLTMTFLALETTGDFRLGLVMLALAAMVSVLLRRWFGYSFATWRLHLRGETIRSAQDVGWIRQMTVERLMRTDAPEAPIDMSVRQFVQAFPLGSRNWVVAVDAAGRYRGMIFGPDIHAVSSTDETNDSTIAGLSRWPNVVLLPQMNVAQAARLFETHESDALAVVDSEADGKVVGLLTEAHLLRRYAAELDSARRALTGEIWTARS
jgi:CIC family chloride channel protein